MTMSMATIIILVTSVILLPKRSAETVEVLNFTQKRIVCYYTFPKSPNGLKPNGIDPHLCTHIIVGFARVKNSWISMSREEEEIVRGVSKIKEQNTNLKIMLSIGGGGGTFGFPEMTSNSINRAKFIESAESVIKKFNLDGIDLDWEFPSNIFKNEKGHFIELLKDVRMSINSSVKPYLCSVAVAAPITLVTMSYDIPKMNKLVDFINIMSYDYNFFSLLTPWTAMNAPLYKRSSDFFYFATQNINFTSDFYPRKGMDKEKINMGLPVYAHTYTLASRNLTYLGAPATGNGKLGGGGSASHGEICDFIRQQNIVPVFDDETKSPYVTDGSEWVSFENAESLRYKAQFIHDIDVGGVMVFSLSSDDHEGKCKKGEVFPNTKVIHSIFSR